MYNFLEAKHPSLKAISATFGVGIIVIIKWFCSKPVPKKFTRLPPAEISLPHILPYNGKFHSTLIFNLLNFKQDRSYCEYCCYSNSSRKTEKVEKLSHLLISATGRHCTGTGGVILVRRVVQLHIECHENHRLAG